MQSSSLGIREAEVSGPQSHGPHVRMPTHPGGLTLGRADFASAGRCTKFHEVIAPPIPFDQQGLVALNFLLCCRCCQALLHIFSSSHSMGSVSHHPEPSGGFFGAQTSRLQCSSTRADADTINTGCNFSTPEMRETTGDLRWDRVRVHLLCLTVEHAIDRATGGKRLDATLPERVANHASADRARPVWR